MAPSNPSPLRWRPHAVNHSTPPPSFGHSGTPAGLEHRRPDSRGFTLSLTVSQPPPSTAHRRRPRLRRLAAEGGCKSLWATRRRTSPGRDDLKVATSAKKDTGPATGRSTGSCSCWSRDVAASKRFYVDRGLAVAKSFGPQVRRVRHSVESRQAGALRAPCPGQGRRRLSGSTGSHRLMIGSDAEPSPTRTGSRGRPDRCEPGGAAQLHRGSTTTPGSGITVATSACNPGARGHR